LFGEKNEKTGTHGINFCYTFDSGAAIRRISFFNGGVMANNDRFDLRLFSTFLVFHECGGVFVDDVSSV
jgi:hypothetical protein